MPTNWEFVRQTKAPMDKVVQYFMQVENLSTLHGDFVKQVTVKNRDADSVVFEQQMEMMRRRIVSQNKLTYMKQDNKIVVDTFEGDGKGSKVTMSFKDVPGGTEVTYNAAMELGPLGFFAKGPAKSSMEKVVNEDAKNLDAMAAA